MAIYGLVVAMAVSVKLGGKAERKGRDVVELCRCGSTKRTVYIYAIGILGYPIGGIVTGPF